MRRFTFKALRHSAFCLGGCGYVRLGHRSIDVRLGREVDCDGLFADRSTGDPVMWNDPMAPSSSYLDAAIKESPAIAAGPRPLAAWVEDLRTIKSTCGTDGRHPICVPPALLNLNPSPGWE